MMAWGQSSMQIRWEPMPSSGGQGAGKGEARAPYEDRPPSFDQSLRRERAGRDVLGFIAFLVSVEAHQSLVCTTASLDCTARQCCLG